MKTIFVSDTKLGKDTTNILNFCFSKKFTFIFPSHHIYPSRKQSLPLTNSTYLVFLLPGMQRRLYRSKYACFYSEKKKTKKTWQSSSCKKHFLHCVCHLYNLLRWMLFVTCDNWKVLFFKKVYRFSEAFLTVVLPFSLKEAFWKKSVFCMLCP